MKEYLTLQKEKIILFLEDYFNKLSSDPILNSKAHSSALNLLLDFTSRGKMLRGGLVVLGYQLFMEDQNPDRIPMASALELMQSALLIHDDIMDLDEMRRGEPTLYYQYVKKSQKAGLRDAHHTGQALGICAGDLAFFIAYEILSQLSCKPEIKSSLLKLFSREMTLVGLAQMDDVAWGAGNEMIAQEQILSLYRHKTGRYTYSLPLAAGAILAGQSDETILWLMELGESLGILFQIKDDELGLLGDQQQLGKPVGSDIREGKKTLHYYNLRNLISSEELQKLNKIYGNNQATQEDIIWVQKLAEGVNLSQVMEDFTQPILQNLEFELNRHQLKISSTKKILHSLVEYNRSRKK